METGGAAVPLEVPLLTSTVVCMLVAVIFLDCIGKGLLLAAMIIFFWECTGKFLLAAGVDFPTVGGGARGALAKTGGAGAAAGGAGEEGDAAVLLGGARGSRP